MICKLCFSNHTDSIYKPLNSKFESTIFICSNCGFVFAVPDSSLYEISNKEVKNKGFTKLSCDADYSEIRVGKQQMVKYFFENTKELAFKFPIKKVLDLRSARGHFVLMAINHFL